MAGRIYLLGADKTLLPMDESPYDSEDLLQTLLADHPDLLAGEQINSDEPRRWLLVTREMAVPGEQGGGSRWSLDHLFLDQDAVPTLVEVKRSSDTRIRREVMGQMLDYAANAVVYWPVEEIQVKFEARCEREGIGPNKELVNLLGADHDADRFWKQVKTNLQAGRIRMVFIADEIPSELRRIVEFLNSQMDPAEVLAVEIKQFVGEGVTTLVPRVIGQTEAARQKKASVSVREHISEQDFLSTFDAERSEAEQNVARTLISWAKVKGLREEFRSGKRGAAFIPVLEQGGIPYYPLSLQSRGWASVQLRWLKDRPPFNDRQKRQELLQRVKSIPNLVATEEAIDGFPKFPVTSLTDQRELDRFISTLDWIVQEIGQVPAQQ